MIGAEQQSDLCHAERRDDEAPYQHDQGHASAAASHQTDHRENPQAYDEKDAERHVQLQQRERVAGPEADPEHDERDAEEADEQARDENDGLHGGLAGARGSRQFGRVVAPGS